MINEYAHTLSDAPQIKSIPFDFNFLLMDWKIPQIFDPFLCAIKN